MNQRWLTIVALLLVFACSGRNTGGPSQFEGAVSDVGWIQGGEIAIYSYANSEVGQELGRVRYDTQLSAELPKYSGPLLLRLEKGVVLDVASNVRVNLSDDHPWELAIDEFQGNPGSINALFVSGQTINVNPLTTMMAGYARWLVRKGGYATGDAIARANDEFTRLLGFDPTTTTASGIGTDLGAVDPMDVHGLYLAGFSALAAEISWRNGYALGKRFTVRELTERLTADLEADGKWDGKDALGNMTEGVYVFSALTPRDEFLTALMRFMRDLTLNGTGLTPEDLTTWLNGWMGTDVPFSKASGQVLPVDSSGPIVTVLAPENGKFYHGNVEVKASARENESWVAAMRVEVGDSKLPLVDTDSVTDTFAGVLDTTQFADGALNVAVVATNVLGIETRKNVAIGVSNTGPLIRFEGFETCTGGECPFDLLDNDVVREQLKIRVTAAPAAGAPIQSFSVLIYGRTLTDEDPDPNVFVHTIRPVDDVIPEGPFEVAAVAIDASGSVVETNRTLHVNMFTFNAQASIPRGGSPVVNTTSWRWGTIFNAGDMRRDFGSELGVLDSANGLLRFASGFGGAFTESWPVGAVAWDAMAANCDVNGDGIPDLVVGSRTGAPGGLVRVYFGPVHDGGVFSGSVDYHGYSNSVRDERIGRSIACAAMDGVLGDEIVVTSDEQEINGGVTTKTAEWLRILSYRGNATWVVYDSSAIATLHQNGVAGVLVDGNTRVSGPMDFNGDGKQDVLLTDVRGSAPDERYSFVVLGNHSGAFTLSPNLLVNHLALPAAQPDVSGLPCFMTVRGAALGDLNRDGYDDLAISQLNVVRAATECAASASSGAGEVKIVYGGTLPVPNADWINYPLAGCADGSCRFGESVVLGDFDGDRQKDLAISAPGSSGGNGAVFLFYGPMGSGRTQTITSIVPGGGTWFGGRLLAIDVNGDRRSELVISSWGDVGSSRDGNLEMLFDTL
jgi:hypothetical protein